MNEWLRLRTLLEESVEAMAWRLETLSDTERITFLDELTDRLIGQVDLRAKP
jgi:hypothetical protein